MQELKTNKPLQEALQELIELSRKKEVKNQSVTFELADEVKELLENELGKSVAGFVFQIDIYAIKHIFKEHGDEKKEAIRGQIAIKDDDIFLLIDVLQTPDIVFDSGKNKMGKDTLTFVKSFEGKYVVVQEIREGRKTIALNSMRIFKAKRTKLP